MPTLTLIIILGFAVISILPLLKEKNRTKWGYINAIGTTTAALLLIFYATFFQINLFLGIGALVVVMFLVDRKTYTKAGAISIGVLALIAGSVAYFVLREDLDYVVDHLTTNPTSSYYFAVNGEELASRNSATNFPLASTAKMTIAAVFAEEVTAGTIDPNEEIETSELEKFYLPNSDGGAHPAWLDDVDEPTVSLAEVVRGMISFSSNANTDYMLERLGIDHINERIDSWGLTAHGDLIPFVSGILAIEERADDLEELTFPEYKEQTLAIHQEIIAGTKTTNDKELSLPLGDQRYWSDWLPSSTTAEYSEWLDNVQTGEWADAETTAYFLAILADPYPELNGFKQTGGKGGSTAFVLTGARFFETEDSDVIQWSMFADDLSAWQRFKLTRNYPRFLQQFIEDPEFQAEMLEIL
ncbi:D-alanyl-D-alanine carboxypeptidase [Bacillus sp. JCM 19045]|nr:D-alanyl-D-alanine carboxypeptidase [Bacillus sp. JCM 19045]